MNALLLFLAALDAILPGTCPHCGGLRGLGRLRLLCTACTPNAGLLPRWVPPPDPVAGAWTLGLYAGPLGSLVRRGKYRPDPTAIRALGALAASAAGGRLPAVNAVCPVPVPLRRRLRRGFNQAALLAHPVARALGAPVLHPLRRVDAREQAGRSAAQRRAAARHAFRATPPVPARVLLVDDVLTTGSTAAACADELLGAGARRVYLLTAVRSPPKPP